MTSQQDFIRALDDEYLECRRYGHHWQSHTVDLVRRRYEVVLQCGRCEALAKEVLNAYGEIVVRRRVYYPKGYVSRGIGPIDRNEIRLESVLRVVDPSHHTA